MNRLVVPVVSAVAGLFAAACPGPPPPVDPSKLQPTTVNEQTVSVPGGWTAREDADQSVRVDSPEKDIVLNVGAVPFPGNGPLGEERAGTFTKKGLERIGAKDVTPLGSAGASAGTVHCAKGTSGANIVVFCFHDTGALRSGDAMSMIIFQGTQAGWARTGQTLLVAVLESMKGFRPLQ